MSWSARSRFAREESTLARLCAGRRDLLDLTESNPTRCGFGDAARLAALADPRAAHYAPEPFGTHVAREAVARYYARRGVAVDPSHLVLTASTSEAYGWLMSLTCDPGQAWLAPQPSYPLIAHLAQLAAVQVLDYPLRRQDDWRIDRGVVEARIARARAVLLVHPNNPTGALVHPEDAAWLAALCAARDVSLIVDEVFLDYAPQFTSFAAEPRARCFTLSGLSKVALAPQIKLGWIAVGPVARAEALARLELIADSYLSVSTPAQLVAPSLLDGADVLQAALRARLDENLTILDAALAAMGAGCPVTRWPRPAGWYALLQLPRTRADDAWLERIIGEAGVIVHPGYFFDMDEEGVIVLSLLTDPAVMTQGLARLLPAVAAGA